MEKESRILVTGGAGYIGSHTVHEMSRRGLGTVVLDNLFRGHREALEGLDVDLVVGDVGNRTLLEEVFSAYAIRAVIHFAAHTYVGESVQHPLTYYQNNVAQPIALLEAMAAHGCDQFIFSSTCATYGEPQRMPLDESHPQYPINPYGQSKLMLEKILADAESAHGLRSVKLRYFNACGAHPEGIIGEDHDPETHIIPLALMTLTGERKDFTILGADYPTPDGTCIRDYVHVLDLASAHLSALDYLESGGSSLACNLGTGCGYSVRQIIDTIERVTQKKVPIRQGERRPGDPPELVADPSLAREKLGWSAQYPEVDFAIETAWKWFNGPRRGRYRVSS